uniref:Uncharacterized protein n=1 Tax=viral metagenome TaxID=1070528 RepID=A0A6H1Z756_9ZZZZ
MKIKPEILDILSNCEIEGDIIYLPAGQLERSVYLKVNECLENSGLRLKR